MVSIITELNGPELERIINKVHKVCKTDPNLSPRTKSELVTACNDGRLVVAMNKASPVGWILRLPYANDSQELAAAYVVDSYRSKGIFTELLGEAIKQVKISILVTFNKQLVNFLTRKQDFKESSLWEVIKISKGQFLLDRLNIERLIAIVKHFTKSSPTYLIFERK